jgi:signal transduction histidine kinase
LSANPEASRLLGVSLDEAAGQTVAAVFPAIPDEQLRRYETVAATGVADDLGEFRYGDERVADRWWSVQAFPLPDRCVGVAFRDVSVRKQAEAEVARLNVELEDRVRIRTAELAEVNQDLVQKNAENEMFVYSVSHDLRSPLVNLQGFSKELDKAGRTLGTLFEEPEVPEPIRDRGRELLAGKFAKSVGFIQTAVLRLSGIIDALLRLSRAGRVEYRWEVVDVSHVVGRVVTAMHATVVEKGAIVNANGLPPAWGDQSAVEQIFANLIGNALAYLDPSRPGRIEVGYLPAGPDEKAQTYFVRDNGLGIPETHQAKIFQVFQRAHPSVAKGEGLGLAIVSRVAERHRGRTWVESRAGEGSTFFVSLPVPPNANGPSTPADPCGNVSEAAS